MSIQEILESAGLPAQRGVYTGRDKPDAYYTFLRLLGTPAVNADDEEKERREMYRVALTRMYITPAPTHGTSLSVKSADRQKRRRAAMKKQYGIFLQARA